MLISRQKKESNIAEYILYMWQLEDILRANNFDKESINRLLVEPLSIDEENKQAIAAWYAKLIEKMKAQGLQKTGHLEETHEAINELQYLHNMLLNTLKDKKYQQLYLAAKLNIDAFKIKSGNPGMGDIEAILNGLYGLLLLRLKKKPVSRDTEEAMESFSKMMAYLVKKYHETKSGPA